MNRFALEEFSIIKGNVRFYKLKVNNGCPIDDFWNQIEQEGNLAKQLNSAIAIMERHAQGQALGQNKFKKISTAKDPVNEYEVKTKDLRIYLFRDKNGAIVVSGGKKSTQPNDITRFKNLVKEYCNKQKI